MPVCEKQTGIIFLWSLVYSKKNIELCNACGYGLHWPRTEKKIKIDTKTRTKDNMKYKS